MCYRSAMLQLAVWASAWFHIPNPSLFSINSKQVAGVEAERAGAGAYPFTCTTYSGHPWHIMASHRILSFLFIGNSPQIPLNLISTLSPELNGSSWQLQTLWDWLPEGNFTMEFAWQSIRSVIRGFDALRTRMRERAVHDQRQSKKIILTWSISLSSLTILGTGTFTPSMTRLTDSVLRQKNAALAIVSMIKFAWLLVKKKRWPP